MILSPIMIDVHITTAEKFLLLAAEKTPELLASHPIQEVFDEFKELYSQRKLKESYEREYCKKFQAFIDTMFTHETEDREYELRRSNMRARFRLMSSDLKKGKGGIKEKIGFNMVGDSVGR